MDSTMNSTFLLCFLLFSTYLSYGVASSSSATTTMHTNNWAVLMRGGFRLEGKSELGNLKNPCKIGTLNSVY
ncbi:hypothetical protein KY289_005083 [Solanum tuberosum]|nr:hypothetical protein KY289_005083 [Solanum tuberosum]